MEKSYPQLYDRDLEHRLQKWKRAWKKSARLGCIDERVTY